MNGKAYLQTSAVIKVYFTKDGKRIGQYIGNRLIKRLTWNFSDILDDLSFDMLCMGVIPENVYRIDLKCPRETWVFSIKK